jgi:hypothetical protein
MLFLFTATYTVGEHPICRYGYRTCNRDAADVFHWTGANFAECKEEAVKLTTELRLYQRLTTPPVPQYVFVVL